MLHDSCYYRPTNPLSFTCGHAVRFWEGCCPPDVCGLYLCETGVSVPAPDVSIAPQCSLPGANQTGTAGATSQPPGCPAGPRATPQQTGHHQGQFFPEKCRALAGSVEGEERTEKGSGVRNPCSFSHFLCLTSVPPHRFHLYSCP